MAKSLSGEIRGEAVQVKSEKPTHLTRMGSHNGRRATFRNQFLKLMLCHDVEGVGVNDHGPVVVGQKIGDELFSVFAKAETRSDHDRSILSKVFSIRLIL